MDLTPASDFAMARRCVDSVPERCQRPPADLNSSNSRRRSRGTIPKRAFLCPLCSLCLSADYLGSGRNAVSSICVVDYVNCLAIANSIEQADLRCHVSQLCLLPSHTSPTCMMAALGRPCSPNCAKSPLALRDRTPAPFCNPRMRVGPARRRPGAALLQVRVFFEFFAFFAPFPPT